MSKALPHIATAIDRFGRFYNGFEANGVENIPLDRPAMLVFYHGFMPLDAWYFGAQFYLRTGRVIHGLGDKFLFKTPGLSWLVETMGAVPGTRENALELLRQGELVGVSPGGVREALAPRERHYEVIWGDRMGFAEVAIEAGVDLIPGFCENVEELYRAAFVSRPSVQRLYERTRLPLVLPVGLGAMPFPVKIRGWLGEPISILPGESAESLRLRVRDALQELMDTHQSQARPRILHGITQRIWGESS